MIKDTHSWPPSFDGVPKFPLGVLRITTKAAQSLDSIDIVKALHRHLQGDWGTLDDEDHQANDAAIKHQARILSSYEAEHPGSMLKTQFWILTEADRRYTTILLPEEY
ncbi:MAG: hypothetical protein ACO1QB_04380 [Verrucomicrobiales bacterium]